MARERMVVVSDSDPATPAASTQPSLLDPMPRRMSRRGAVLLGVVILALIGVLLLMVRLYSSEGGVRFTSAGEVANADITALLRPIDLDPQTNMARMQLTFIDVSADLVNDTGQVKKPMSIWVRDWEGDQEFRFPAGATLGRSQFSVPVDGEEAYYPFDRYQTNVMIDAATMTKQPDGTLTRDATLNVDVRSEGGIYGWDTDVTGIPSAAFGAGAFLGFNRAFSVQLFAIALLALMVILAAVGVVMALLVASARRPMEVPLLAWLGSILFALPLLRNSLPGGPPIGANIDIFVFFWVLMAVLASAVTTAVTWIRQRRLALLAGRSIS